MRGRLARGTVVAAAVATGVATMVTGALGDGGFSPGAVQGSNGVLAPDGPFRYVAVPGGRGTAIVRVHTRGGGVFGFRWLQGNWGVPLVTFTSYGDGVTTDGRTLVLASMPSGNAIPRKRSGFAVLDTRAMRVRRVVWLRGDFSFDAISPDGETLFLIQHVGAAYMNRYLVRAYDLKRQRLLRHIIADRRSWDSTMTGTPVRRISSRGGRWVYTLYMTGGRLKPFVHALDTRRAAAVCIDLPWRGSQNRVWNLRLSLRRGGRLVIREQGGRRRLFVVATRTHRALLASSR